MRILMLACADSIHTVRWANAFFRKGHEVIVVANNNHREKNDKLDIGIVKHYLPFSGSLGYYLNSVFLSTLVAKEKPDVINVHYASGYGTLARIARVRPVVLNVWGSDVYSFPSSSKIKKTIVTRNLLYADRIASTSNTMAEQIRRLLPNKQIGITVTPFGVDIDRFKPDVDSLSKNNKKFVFGTAKNLKKIYGIDLIIRAFAIVYKKWEENGKLSPEPTLSIYGDGIERLSLEALTDSLSLQHSVTFYGAVANDSIPIAINGMDVFCLASHSESFGVSAIEAMSCGVPVVASDADGFLEVIDAGTTGLIFHRGDVEELANNMWNLFCNSELRTQMGKKARLHVLKHYNWNENVSMLERVLVNCTGKKEL